MILFIFTVITFPFFSISQTTVLSEDFEPGTIPSGWSQYTLSTDNGWKYGDSATLSSQYYRIPEHGNFLATNADACQCNKGSDYLITPYFDLSAMSAVFMNFSSYFEGDKNWGLGAEFYAEKATVEVSTDSGETWIIIDSLEGQRYQWVSHELNLSAFAGYPSVLISFRYNDNTIVSGYPGFGYAIDDIKIYEPVQRDLSLISIGNSQYSISGNTIFSGKLRNIGATAIYSFDLNYSIDGGTKVTSHVSGDTIQPFAYYDFTHLVPFNASAGIDTLQFWVNNVNGLGNDLMTGNDSLGKIISFVSSFVQRKILVEEFTSANCSGCSTVNAIINPLLDSNASKVAQIRYHGLDDVMYFYDPPDNELRTSYYDIEAFPQVIADGQCSLSSQQDIDSIFNGPSVFNIHISALLNGSLIYMDVSSISYADVISGDLILYLALVEDKQFQNPPGLNGETFFPKVLREMIPDAGGNSIGTPVLNQTDHFLFTLPNDTAYNAENLFAVAFVQDKHSKIVYQSASAKVISLDTTSLSVPNENYSINIYPQPADNILTIGTLFSKMDFQKLSITDLSGKIIYSKKVNQGSNFISIDVSAFQDGCFVLTLGGKASYRKLISIVH